MRSVLSELKQIYPHIRYTIVLAYLPSHYNRLEKEEYLNTMLPEGIETVPKRFAILWRNKWMLRQAEYVVVYEIHSVGMTSRFVDMAKRQGKTIRKV